MKLIETSLRRYCKKNKYLRKIYYKNCNFLYSFISIIFNVFNINYDLNFIRKALSYGVKPNILKKKILFHSKNIDYSKNNLFLLVAILSSLGYVHIGRRILWNHSTHKKLASTRIFKSDLFSAYGHVALLDIFIKAKILGYQQYRHDYIEGNISNFTQVFTRDFFKFRHVLEKNKNSFYENFNYTFLNDNFILFDEFTSKVQIDFERKFSSTINDVFIGKLIKPKKATIFPCKDPEWYVCLHVRHGYDRLTDLRNASVQTYYKAVKSILSAGGHVFRLDADATVFSMHIENGCISENLYSSDLNSQLEIISRCRFFIGCGSGPINMASHVFGRPILSTNWAPLGCRLPWKNQVILPKKFIKNDFSTEIPYSNRLRGGLSRIESKQRLNELGYTCIDNHENEIDEAVCEMLEATKTRTFVGNYFLKTELQRKFYELITNHHKLIPIFISKSYSEKHMLEIK